MSNSRVMTRRGALGALAGVACCFGASGPSVRDVDQITGNEDELLANLGPVRFELYVQSLNGGKVVGDELRWGVAKWGTHGPAVTEFPIRSPETKALLPSGFVQMIVPGVDWDRYSWTDGGYEFLEGSDVYCQRWQVAPKDARFGNGMFTGDIWVENHAIVRCNGTYTSSGKRPSPYVHFDSVRQKSGGRWVPSFVFVSQRELPRHILGGSEIRARLSVWPWPGKADALTEHTALRVREEELGSKSDEPEGHDPHQVVADRARSMLGWMEGNGMLARRGKVEETLEAVVKQLLDRSGTPYRWPLSVRLLLSTPLESFTCGDTIVISKSALDVFPASRDDDNSALAVALAPEISHILLGHENKWEFDDFFQHGPETALKKLNFARTQSEIIEADNKALDLLGKAGYTQGKLDGTASYLRLSSEVCRQLRAQFTPLLGNPLPGRDPGRPMARLAGRRVGADIAAYPVGSRTRLDWSTRAVDLVAPPDKDAPFQVIAMDLPTISPRHGEAAAEPFPPPARVYPQPARWALKP